MSTYYWGLDLAFCTGIAIYSLENRNFIEVDHIDVSKVNLLKKDRDNGINLHAKKLRLIKEYIDEMKEKYPPKLIAIESTFGGRFRNAIIALSKVHGVINEMFAETAIYYYAPKEIKKWIVNGNATKADVEEEILDRFPELTFDTDDESDACASILTHLIKNKTIEW